jgi:hypothetical protein
MMVFAAALIAPGVMMAAALVAASVMMAAALVAASVMMAAALVAAALMGLRNSSVDVTGACRSQGMPEASIQSQSLLQPIHGRAELTSLIHVLQSPELGFRCSIAMTAQVCGCPDIRRPGTHAASILRIRAGIARTAARFGRQGRPNGRVGEADLTRFTRHKD